MKDNENELYECADRKWIRDQDISTEITVRVGSRCGDFISSKRLVDQDREEKYTNQYTVNTLFPDENPKEALKRELKTLTVEEYMKTVKDLRFPKRSDMREFGKVYNGQDDVYIKIRVELLNAYGKTATFVMSFHFAEKAFTPEMFPYRKS